MKKIKYAALLFACICLSLAGSAQKDKNLLDDEYEVQFLKVGVEGTILFKIYSYGSNEDNCIANAKRNAVKAVIFDGIPGSDLQRPLVTEAGADEKYRDYFTAFFQKNGKYVRYVSISTDGSIDPNDRLRVGKRLKIGIAVLVQKASLRRELESAGIIKTLSAGF